MPFLSFYLHLRFPPDVNINFPVRLFLHLAVAGSDLAKADARSDHADLYAYVVINSPSERLF